MKLKQILCLVVVGDLLSLPAHAYAGPGVALGAIIVFFTVLLTFFASVLISIFNFFKNNIKKIKRSGNKRSKKNK